MSEPIRLYPRAVATRLDVWRCPNCNTILAKLRLAPGSLVEIKCARCNVMAIKEAA